MKRNAIPMIAAAALLGLAGCSHVPDSINPVSWYRHVTGASQKSALAKPPSDLDAAESGATPKAAPTSAAAAATKTASAAPSAAAAEDPPPPDLKKLDAEAGQILAGAEADPEESNPAGPGAAMRTLPPAPAPMEGVETLTQIALAVAAPPEPASPRASSLAVVQIDFAKGSAALAEAPRARIAEIVKDFKEKGGTIRIVGHGGEAGKNAAPKLALDRAQAVAAALTKSGVPDDAISVEAAPAPEKGDVARADVFLAR